MAERKPLIGGIIGCLTIIKARSPSVGNLTKI